MNCPECKLLLDTPSEVLRGAAVGVCSGCGCLFGPAAPKVVAFVPDVRGRPSKPGKAA